MEGRGYGRRALPAQEGRDLISEHYGLAVVYFAYLELRSFVHLLGFQCIGMAQLHKSDGV